VTNVREEFVVKKKKNSARAGGKRRKESLEGGPKPRGMIKRPHGRIRKKKSESLRGEKRGSLGRRGLKWTFIETGLATGQKINVKKKLKGKRRKQRKRRLSDVTPRSN